MMSKGLMTSGYDRFDIVSAHAAFADWWNTGGLTDRDRDPSRNGQSASVQLHNMRYRPGMGDYFEKGSAAADVYLGLVAKYHPESLEQEEEEWECTD